MRDRHAATQGASARRRAAGSVGTTTQRAPFNCAGPSAASWASSIIYHLHRDRRLA
jgi:hypothetical protein